MDLVCLFVCWTLDLKAYEHIGFWFLVCYAATQLALQLQQERIQVVRSISSTNLGTTNVQYTLSCTQPSKIAAKGVGRGATTWGNWSTRVAEDLGRSSDVLHYLH